MMSYYKVNSCGLEVVPSDAVCPFWLRVKTLFKGVSYYHFSTVYKQKQMGASPNTLLGLVNNSSNSNQVKLVFVISKHSVVLNGRYLRE